MRLYKPVKPSRTVRSNISRLEAFLARIGPNELHHDVRPEANPVAVLKADGRTHRHTMTINERSVCASQVGQACLPLGVHLDQGVPARDAGVGKLDIVVRGAAEFRPAGKKGQHCAGMPPLRTMKYIGKPELAASDSSKVAEYISLKNVAPFSSMANPAVFKRRFLATRSCSQHLVDRIDRLVRKVGRRWKLSNRTNPRVRKVGRAVRSSTSKSCFFLRRPGVFKRRANR